MSINVEYILTSINVSRPVFNEIDILSHLSMEYELSGILKSLPSDRDQNFLLTTDDQIHFVCKISNYNEDQQNLVDQHIIMNHLFLKNNQLCPTVFPNVNDSQITNIQFEDGRTFLFRVVTYLPGNVYAKYKPHSSQFMISLGRFMAEVRIGLEGIKLQVEKPSFDWDIEHGIDTIKKHSKYITHSNQSELIQNYLKRFEITFLKDLNELEKGIIHGDANDYNVIVQNPSNLEGDIHFGLIDFGDFAYSPKVTDLAISITYAILDKPNPLVTIMQIIQGYNSLHRLKENERKIIFPMILMRLCISVSISAFQKKLEPDNEYLTISEVPAWKTLASLKQISPKYVYYLIRYACGIDPHPNNYRVVEWLKSQKPVPILKTGYGHSSLDDFYHMVDLSIGSLEISGLRNASHLNYYNDLIKRKLDYFEFVVGRYGELRAMYFHENFEILESDYLSWRSVHIGIDIFHEPRTSISAPISGEIFRIADYNEPLDYGPTVIFKHLIDETTEFYTLYGHLSKSSISNLQVGQIIQQGEEFAKVGIEDENGSWTPHIHIQIILDLLDFTSSFPGVCSYLEKDIWLSICPDPNLLLNLSGIDIKNSSKLTTQVKQLRSKHSSSVMSISYDEPLHIVRGFAQYLYDINGRRYLDAINNVPIIGHSHPQIVHDLSRQAGVLNTNTRYLQEVFTKYSEKLTSLLPDELEVVFFVNSGSEANELAIRLAKNHTSRNDFIVLDHAYHGNTSGTISISPYKFNGKGGKGKPSTVHIAPLPDPYRGKYQGSNTGEKYALEVKKIVNELETNNTPVAAFIAESLPGVGGQIVIPDKFFPNVYRKIREAGGVCIADEVQVGFARMGTNYWGFEIYGVVPDIVTLGKPIGNGHPIGAVITTREIANSFANGMEFFSTTGGNTVSMAVGLSVLRSIEIEHFQQNAKLVGDYLLDKLIELKIQHEIIGDVRGHGLFLGIEIVKSKQDKNPAPTLCKYIVQQMKYRGVLLSVEGPDLNVIKIKPPLPFSIANADTLILELKTVLSHSCLQ